LRSNSANENKNRSYCNAILARRKVLKGNKTLLQHGHRRCKREKLLPALASGMACANNEGM
jgi:hypothetical protein